MDLKVADRLKSAIWVLVHLLVIGLPAALAPYLVDAYGGLTAVLVLIPLSCAYGVLLGKLILHPNRALGRLLRKFLG